MTKLAPPIPTNQTIEEVLGPLEASSHWERRLFIKKRLYAQYPRFFYKFLGTDPRSPTSIQRLRDVMVESRLWLADHEKFNDPFDLKANVLFKGTVKEKEKRLKALIANQSQGAPRKQRRELLAQFMRRNDVDWAAVVREIFRVRTREIGVFSFATDRKPFPGQPEVAEAAPHTPPERSGPRSILMWTHYGRNHEGVCVQFETALSPRVFTVAQQVQYSDEYPRLNYVANFEKDLLVPLVRKHKGWEYEREWRVLHMTGVNTYLPFEPPAIARMIFGCRASPELYAAVLSLLEERATRGYPPVRLFRAVQHPTEYRLLLWSLRERR